MNMTSDELVKKYEPLVNKMTAQFFNKGLMSWGDLKSMAYEGLAIAINTYDEGKSKMTFTQFAAFAIRNNMLTSIDNELRVVKLSNYAQKKAIEAGETTFNSVSIDYTIREDDERKPLEIKLGMVSNASFADGDTFDYLKVRLTEEFSERDCNIFYKTFGLYGHDEEKGKDIAKELGISEGLVSQKIKKVITFIRKDKDLCEMLANLVG